MEDDNTFKSTYDQLTELSEVYPKLTDAQRAYLQYVIAGQRQGNIFSGMMQNMTEGVDAYNTALNSANSSQKEQERFMNSIEGKINKFTETLKGVWVDAISSDSIKTIVDMGTSVLEVVGSMSNTFGALPTTIGIATAAIMLFNKEMYLGISKNIPLMGTLNKGISVISASIENKVGGVIINAFDKWSTSVTSTTAKTAILKTGNIALTASMGAVSVAATLATAALTMGLSVAITALIGGLTKFIDKIIVTKSELKEMNKEATNTLTEGAKSISQAEELLAKKKQLDTQLGKAEDTSKRKDLETELLEVQKQLSQVLPQSASGFDAEGEAISASNSLIEEQIRLKKEEMELASLSFIQNNKRLSGELSALDEKKKKYEEMKLAMMQGKQYEETYTGYDRYSGQEITYTNKTTVTADMLSKMNKEIEETSLKAQQAQTHIKFLLENGYSMSELNEMGFDTASVERYIKSINDSTDALNKNSDAKENNGNAGNNGTTMSIEDATKAYADVISKTQEYYDMLAKVNEAGAITPSLVKDLASSYPELGTRITDISAVQQFLNDKIAESATAQQNAYVAMLANDQSYYNSKVKNNNELANSFNQLCKTFVDNNGKSYDLDIKNYSSLQEMKNDLTNKFGESIATFVTNFVTANAEGYSVDLSNTSSWASSKAKILNDLNNQIAKVKRNLSNLVNDIAKTDSALSSEGLNQEKLYNKQLQQLDNLMSKQEEVQTQFSSYDFGFAGFAPTFSGSDFSSGTGSSGTGSSSSAEKEIADLENLTDRYWQCLEAIDEYNSALSMNKILIENSTGDKKVEYMNKQIELYKKLQKEVSTLTGEYAREQRELRSFIESQGARVDASGSIINYNDLLANKTNWANSQSGADKENAIAQVKALQEALQRYTDLTNKLIPEQQQQWESLNGTIEDAKKEIEDLYKSQLETIGNNENEISKVIEYEYRKRYDEKKKAIEKEMKLEDERLNRLKESLQKEKEIFNKNIEEDNYNSNLAKERQKLAEIQAEIDRLSMATDAKSKAMLQSLMKDYQAQQEAINQMIKDKTQNDVNDRFTQEEELLDDQIEQSKDKFESILDELENNLTEFLKPENINKLISDGIVDGFVTMGDTVIDLKQSMSDMLNETTVGFTNITLGISDFNSELKDAISLYGNLNNIINGANLSGVNLNASGVSRSANPISITMGDLNIQGSVSDSNLGDIQSMLDKQKNDVIKEISKQLNSR